MFAEIMVVSMPVPVWIVAASCLVFGWVFSRAMTRRPHHTTQYVSHVMSNRGFVAPRAMEVTIKFPGAKPFSRCLIPGDSLVWGDVVDKTEVWGVLPPEAEAERTKEDADSRRLAAKYGEE